MAGSTATKPTPPTAGFCGPKVIVTSFLVPKLKETCLLLLYDVK